MCYVIAVGALHSTGQIIGMLSWMADFAQMTQCYEEETTESYEKVYLKMPTVYFN